MPLRKRILYDPAAYHRKDVFEESTLDTYLQDHNMSKMLGAMNQIAYLSTFALEVMQNLSILTEDLSERIKVASVRTKNLYGNLKSVDRQVASIDDESHVAAIPGMSKYLQSREMFTPQLFNKSTNYSSVSLQYRICRSPPQLWRIEVFTDEDCFRNYSNPGFFFQEWIRSEIIRQRRGKEEKKRNKALKKAQRQERKKLKEAAAEEELFNTIYSSADVSANASANVSLSGLTGERRNKSMLRYNRANEDRFDEPIAQSQGQTRQQQQLQGWQYEHQNTADDVEDSPWPDQRAQQQDHSGWMYETDEQAPPGSGAEGVEAEEEEDYENEDANIDRAASAAAAAASASTKSKGKSKLKGLTKLFKKKKSKKAGAVEDSTDEETSPTNAGTGGAAAGPRPSFSKMDSRSMHMLDVPATDRERGRNPRQQEEEGHDGDSGNEDQLQNQRSPRLPKSTVPNHTPKPPPRPMSYADELAARAVNTRRQSLLHNTNTMDLHLHTASDPSAAEHTHPYGIDNNNNITEMEDVEPNLVMSIKVPKKQQKAPVTMKIGNKFLSASTLGKVGATTPLLTSSSATSALESSSMTATGVSGVSGRLADAQRRGSRVNMVHSSAVLSTEAAGELGGAGAGANWETQRLASKGNLLLKPPPPTADRPAGSMSAPGKRASFAAAGMNSSSLLLLGSNNKRQSFSLAGGANHNNHNNNNSSSSIYNNISTGIGAGRSGRWDSEDLGSVLGASGARKKSLLTLLQEEVLQGEEEDLPANDYVLDKGNGDGDGGPGEDEDGVDIDELDVDAEFNNNNMSYENENGEDGVEKEEDEPPSDNEDADMEGPSDSPPPSDKDEEEGAEDEARAKRQPSNSINSGRRSSAAGAAGKRPGAPPPPPPPPAHQPRSALGDSILGSLKAGGASLKKVDPPPEPKIDERTHLLRSIQLGSVQLKSAAAGAGAKAKQFQKIDVKQNEAVAAILANRSKIAGSDTESSDGSDSDYTDDDY